MDVINPIFALAGAGVVRPISLRWTAARGSRRAARRHNIFDPGRSSSRPGSPPPAALPLPVGRRFCRTS